MCSLPCISTSADVEKRPKLEQVDFYLRYEDPRALGRQTSGPRTPRGQGAAADRVSLGLLAVLKLEWGERLAGRSWAAVSHGWVRLDRRRLGGLSRSRLRFVARPTLIDDGVQLDFRADRLSLVDRSALQLRPSRCDSHGQDRRDSSPRHESQLSPA